MIYHEDRAYLCGMKTTKNTKKTKKRKSNAGRPRLVKGSLCATVTFSCPLTVSKLIRVRAKQNKATLSAFMRPYLELAANGKPSTTKAKAA